MKIVLINETWGLAGGQEEYIFQVGNGLAARGHEVRLIFGRRSGEKRGTEAARFEAEEIENLRVERVLETTRRLEADVVNLQNVFDPELVQMLLQNFATTRFVHDHSPYCPGNSKYFFNSGKICTIATSATCFLNAYKEKCMTRHPLSALKKIGQRQSWLAALKKLPVVLCNSSYVKERLVQNGLKEERVLVNHLFPGLGDWPRSKAPPQTEPTKITEVLFVGRLFKEKGVDFLIRASAQLKIPFVLKIVGEGWEKERLVNLARDLGLAEKVKFLGFKVGAELAELYQQSSFLVLPSLWPEPFGMVGLEAHLLGKPVIAFDVGGIHDWLEDGVNGFLITTSKRQGAIEALSGRIETLAANKALGQKMGEAGREKVSRYFNRQRHLDVLERVYADLIGKKS